MLLLAGIIGQALVSLGILAWAVRATTQRDEARSRLLYAEQRLLGVSEQLIRQEDNILEGEWHDLDAVHG